MNEEKMDDLIYGMRREIAASDKQLAVLMERSENMERQIEDIRKMFWWIVTMFGATAVSMTGLLIKSLS